MPDAIESTGPRPPTTMLAAARAAIAHAQAASDLLPPAGITDDREMSWHRAQAADAAAHAEIAQAWAMIAGFTWYLPRGQ